MRRLFSIFFLFLFLFNVGGYYLVFVGWQYRASLKVAEKLDNNLYDEDETYLFRIPLTLPYEITDNGYERVSGLIEHRGTFYRLVKQRYSADTLYIVCIRDHARKIIDTELTKYAHLSNDVPISQETKPISYSATFSKDFNTNQLLEILNPDAGYLKSYYAWASTFSLQNWDAMVPTPPPEPMVG